MPPRPPKIAPAPPESFLPLTPAIYEILLTLADDERHGYAIMSEINQRAADEIRIGPGTLYRSIRRMLEMGLIDESDERPDPALDDERRRYYRLTELGRRVARAESERLARLVTLARQARLLPSRS